MRRCMSVAMVRGLDTCEGNMMLRTSGHFDAVADVAPLHSDVSTSGSSSRSEVSVV